MQCDPRTIRNNLDVLVKNNLISRSDERKAYIFAPLEYWIPLHWDIIKFFMRLEQDVNWVLMLRIYSVLAYAYANNCNQFTVTDIIKCLGIRDSSRGFILLTLDWLQSLDLLTYSTKRISDLRYGTYYRFTINSIETKSSDKIEQWLCTNDGPLSEEWRKQFNLSSDDNT